MLSDKIAKGEQIDGRRQEKCRAIGLDHDTLQLQDMWKNIHEHMPAPLANCDVCVSE